MGRKGYLSIEVAAAAAAAAERPGSGGSAAYPRGAHLHARDRLGHQGRPACSRKGVEPASGWVPEQRAQPFKMRVSSG